MNYSKTNEAVFQGHIRIELPSVAEREMIQGVRWQSEARTPTPLWLAQDCGRSGRLPNAGFFASWLAVGEGDLRR